MKRREVVKCITESGLEREKAALCVSARYVTIIYGQEGDRSPAPLDRACRWIATKTVAKVCRGVLFLL